MQKVKSVPQNLVMASVVICICIPFEIFEHTWAHAIYWSDCYYTDCVDYTFAYPFLLSELVLLISGLLIMTEKLFFKYLTLVALFVSVVLFLQSGFDFWGFFGVAIFLFRFTSIYFIFKKQQFA